MREGFHLIADCLSDSPRLSDVDLVYDFLRGLTSSVYMTPIHNPVVVKHLSHPDPEWGITGFSLIAESHISIHTYPEQKCFHLDCFSCKSFSVDAVFGYLELMLEVLKHKTFMIHRNKHMPAFMREFIQGEENTWP